MQNVLQTGLSAGMSAVAGYHSSKPTPAPPEYDGKGLVDESYTPEAKSRITVPTQNLTEPVKVSPICIGAWPWGDTATWHWKEEEFPVVQAAWKALYDAGIHFIDTAEVYANGYSEELVGRLVKGLPRESFVIQTKWFGSALKPGSFLHPVDAPLRAIQGSLERMGLEYIDIYLVHGPIHVQGIDSVAKGLAKIVEQGLAKAVGVANYDPEDVVHMKKALEKYGVPLAVNQVEYSVLRRWPEIHGNISTCKENGVVFQGYSSLAQGRLTGKYTPENSPPRSYKFSSYPMEDVMPVVETLRRIGDKYGKGPASVALNWSIVKGCVPLVGIRTPEQAQEAIDALGWRLTPQEVVEIDRVSFEGKRTVTWQQG
ncbi:aldo-keto reductase [Podospora australis]|uniref:Aldo-keto reductase n=1 Tax=Podospora australis TaxID=1536484 RepID=A0AAN7AFX7_9PEZI|nr:aldo-keto reductase [Podospora australis]